MGKFIKFFSIILTTTLFLGSVCHKEKHSTKEARGLWVTRWEWAVKADSIRAIVQQERIKQIFDQAKQAQMNFVLFQIRGHGDAFYQSQFEPWSDLLSDTLGKNPGWDPLAFALEQAHQRGLELHAWFNTFPAWRGTEPPPRTNPEHVFSVHPEWIVCDKNGKPMPLNSNYVSLSPGIPEVRDYIHQVAMDIVKNYDIDGFHFDYIRYPEGADKLGYSQDPVSLHLFNSPEGNPHDLPWEDWQRENINQFVRRFYDEATDMKPWLKISAAVIGKYDDSAWNGYHVVFQDAKKWIDEGKMDFIAPMIYWQTDHPSSPYQRTVKEWYDSPHDRYIFPGMMVNNLGSKDWPISELVDQVMINRHGGNGMVFFSFSGLDNAQQQIGKINFDYLANMPPMSWKDDKPPMDPRNLRVRLMSTGMALLIWSPPDSILEPMDVCRYNIFRSEKSPVDFLTAENLNHITIKADTFFVDKAILGGRTYHYIVTALDRVNNESPPSNQVTITIPQYALVDRLKIPNSE